MSAGLVPLLSARRRMIWNSIRSLRDQSKTKIVVILVFAVVIWAGLFLAFLDGFRFMDTGGLAGLKSIVVDVLFSVFFLALLVLLLFSNGIIAYGSLFRSDETAYLFAQPVAPRHIFSYKLTETLVFSSWAFLFLALPLVVAYGVSDAAPWYFYPGAAILFGVFALIPAALGGAITLLIARFFSASPRRILIAAGGVLTVVLIVWGLRVLSGYRDAGAAAEDGVWMQGVLERLRLSKNLLLPSRWAALGTQHLAQGEIREAGYRFLLLLSNGLFFWLAAVHVSRLIYRNSYHRVQAIRRRRAGKRAGWFYATLERCLFSTKPSMRMLIVKDVKTFLRDPVQWSQVLIFFGLLAVYFLNMRTFGYDVESPRWKNFVSLLNVVVTSLTLSTFTCRFIFPLLSLEGRRFWVLGLLPLDRGELLYSKFWFAFAGAFLISEGLIVVSDLMLNVAWDAMLVHALTILIVCSGLSGMAVGIGALYPNMRETNPSKIVSGFGGTLNLVLSIFYVVVMTGLLAVPYHLRSAFGGLDRSVEFARGLAIPCSIIGAAVGVAATFVPMWLGVRAFQRLET